MTQARGHVDDELREALERNPLFASLEGFYIDDLAERGEIRSWPARSQIISEGDEGDAVYFILSGKAKVTLYGEEGREIVLAVLGESEIFGELSIIDDRPRSANVETTSELKCFVIGKRAFLDYLSTHHKVYRRFFACLTGRLRGATRQIGGLALLDVCGRIAHTLIGMSKDGPADAVGEVSIERPTHEQIAALIGSSREVVSRALKKMSNEGYIRIEKDRIVLHIDP